MRQSAAGASGLFCVYGKSLVRRNRVNIQAAGMFHSSMKQKTGHQGYAFSAYINRYYFVGYENDSNSFSSPLLLRLTVIYLFLNC